MSLPHDIKLNKSYSILELQDQILGKFLLQLMRNFKPFKILINSYSILLRLN